MRVYERERVVCMCVKERECVSVCVCEREKEKEAFYSETTPLVVPAACQPLVNKSIFNLISSQLSF
jgi:hypothetical protein